MRHLALFSALACLLLPFETFAQNSGKLPPAQDFSQEALVYDRYETTIRMHADGTGERIVHAVMRIQSESAAKQFGVLIVNYAAATETPHIISVKVLKPNGTTVETPAAEAIEMASAVTRQAPLYSDFKEKHLPVRSLSAGDTLEYEIDTSIDKPEAPGQFWGTTHFTVPGTTIVRTEIFTLEFPKDKYVQVWSPKHQPAITEHGNLRTYSWTSSQLVAAPKNSEDDDSTRKNQPKDPDEDSDGRKLPSVAWTTFHNWAEVGDWYRNLALQRAQPNDAVRAKAEELTKDGKTPEEQVRAIYAYVSGKTRYVGIDFGIGRYQPHSAAEVLANQYGDCKDKDTLLEALLRAKGFPTAPALIGAGIALVQDIPSPAVFNHVITTVGLPEGRVWLDSTPEVAPYRYLSAVIRDQQALVIPAQETATLEKTPAMTPYSFANTLEAVGTLDAEGKLTAKITATYRGDDEIVVRALARGFARAEWDKASQYVSSSTGFSGTTSNTSFKNIDDLSLPVEISYDYTRHPFGDWENRRILPLFPLLELPSLASDKDAPEDDIDLGAPRTLTAVSKVRLPEGYRTDLPDPIHVKTNFATFDKTYRFDGKEIVVERSVVILQKKLPKADWKQYQSFTKSASLAEENWITLIRPSKPISITVEKSGPTEEKKLSTTKLPSEVKILKSESQKKPSTPKTKEKARDEEVSSDAPLLEQMQTAARQLQEGNWDGARSTLDKIKAKNPDEPFLWGSYGVLAMMKFDYEEAKSDFARELEKHPDNPGAAAALAEAQLRSGDSSAARKTLQSYLTKHPDEEKLSRYLVKMQRDAHDYAGALKTLQAASDQAPEDKILRVEIGETLLLLNRKEEAAAAVKSALDGADDPQILNGAAYVLSETGLSLHVAEEASRTCITKLEEKSATITTAEANSKSFSESQLIVASWDTLGWILFQEGKYDQAKPLLLSAWTNSLRGEVGDHLGQLYEALDQKQQAINAYSLADAAMTQDVPANVRQHVKDRMAQLKAKGVNPTTSGASTLQEVRSFTVPRPGETVGWGAFRLEIAAGKVLEAKQMSGEHHLEGLEKNLGDMKFPELVPPESKAHLLKSAVVNCSKGAKTCEVVLVPDGGLHTEQQ